MKLSLLSFVLVFTNWYFVISEECGLPVVQNPYIIGGTRSVRGRWPWQTLILFDRRAGCAGSLIHPLWVLTAAHCVAGKEGYAFYFKLRFGDFDRRYREPGTINIRASKIISHEDYVPSLLSNDIALIKLSRPVTFNKYVKPVCLPSRDPKPGTKCYITGWGKTDPKIHQMTRFLQQARMDLVSNPVCEAKNYQTIKIKLNPGVVCAGDGGKSRISGCHGDSGGPLVCQDEKTSRWILHGVVSYGSSRCNSKETYTVFSRVHHFMDWIERKMKSN